MGWGEVYARYILELDTLIDEYRGYRIFISEYSPPVLSVVDSNDSAWSCVVENVSGEADHCIGLAKEQVDRLEELRHERSGQLALF